MAIQRTNGFRSQGTVSYHRPVRADLGLLLLFSQSGLSCFFSFYFILFYFIFWCGGGGGSADGSFIGLMVNMSLV